MAGQEGEQWLNKAAALPNDTLQRIQTLRSGISPSRAAAVVEMLELRHKAGGRFANASVMYFTASGVEQATVPAIARYHASQIPPGAQSIDLCCSIGSDLRAFAERGPVLGVDLNLSSLLCARFNTLETHYCVTLLQQDVCSLDLDRIARADPQLLFCDPSRRKISKSGSEVRVRAVSEYSPPLSWLTEVSSRFPQLKLKLSPAIHNDDLAYFGGTVEFISYGGMCREALLHPGTRPLKLRATLIDSTEEVYYLDGEQHETAEISGVQKWLYEPDPAAIRAGYVDSLARMHGAYRLAESIAYLTAEIEIRSPWMQRYSVIHSMPCDIRSMKEWLRKHQMRVDVVKRRGATPEPEQMRSDLKYDSRERLEPVILVLVRLAKGVIAIFCHID